MNGFVFHAAAFADLEEIWEFIAADSLDAADRVLSEIHEAICALVSFPQMGHVRSELASRPLRFHAVRDFVIAYAPDEELYSTAAAIPASWPPYCETGSRPAN